MRTELNSNDYVTFARRFVKETVDTMDIEDLKSLVTQRIHEEIQEGENEFGPVSYTHLTLPTKA